MRRAEFFIEEMLKWDLREDLEGFIVADEERFVEVNWRVERIKVRFMKRCDELEERILDLDAGEFV